MTLNELTTIDRLITDLLKGNKNIRLIEKVDRILFREFALKKIENLYDKY
jgi:hypothetical protein